ncbi:MAG: 5-(carboxyamino)imidazole ribonucleotide mutase [Eubacteriaceae bacterium]|nr:5-(carboxyamino)imidazole ribonucleotide mutase [Eubacteriaceae bacterium]
MANIAIIIGSASDRPVVNRAEEILRSFKVSYTLRVLSAHRTPEETAEFAKTLDGNYDAVIAAAGKAAHLAGAVAAHTLVPVIGLPIKTDVMGGLDSLLSIVQMPRGIPVATVAIDGAENAALLALQIAAPRDPGLLHKLKEYRKQMRESSLSADSEAQSE